MKYKLIGNNITFFPIQTVCKNRGISEDLFKVDSTSIVPYNKLDNIDKGVDLLLSHINKESNILIVVDCDMDGYTSSAVLYRYLIKTFHIKIKLAVHTGKQHGLSDDITIGDDIGLVILPDASSNDFAQHRELKDRGIDVLVIDHHECDEGYSNSAIVINNQISKDYSNKQLSGVGVVYKFIKALDDRTDSNYADEYLDLVALGNVADVMNLKSEETRYYVYEGIKNINNPFIKALMEDNSYDLDGKYNIEKIGWTIAPKGNAVVRSGSIEEKQKMFMAFISDDYDYCLEVAKMCKSIKAKQDREVKSSLGKIEKKIKNVDKCLIIDTSTNLSSSHRGLVAGKLADKYGVPTLLYSEVKDKEGYIGGSFRGSNISEKLRSDLLECEIITMAQGHEQAGGWEIKKDDLHRLEEYLNNLYKDKEISFDKEHEVDFEIEGQQLEQWFVDELAKYEDEFGNGINAPLTIIKNITLTLSDINISRTNITFNYNGVKFIKKFATKVLKEEMTSHQMVCLDIIGKCTINTYNKKGQIEIVDLEIKNKLDLI